MKILITHPCCWPYVRRGSERFMAELSRFLARRGHEVTVLSASPHRREEEVEEGVRIIREKEIPTPWLTRANLWRPETTFALVVRRFLDENSFDLIHCLHHTDAFGVMWSKRARETPCIYHMTGIPFGRWVRRHPWETWMTHRAIERAARVLVVSRHAARRFHNEFGGTATAINIPCDLSAFTMNRRRNLDRPCILFMGALNEVRKGATPLARAFQAVKKAAPGARLRYCGATDAATPAALLDLIEPEYRCDVEFVGRGRLEDLPRYYGEAAVTVLPATEEALGMVLVESLACGTPVVGCSDGGMTDIVIPGTGVLFDPKPVNTVASNVDGLASAILQTLRLHEDPELPFRCRAAAERFCWDQLGPEYEKVYDEIAVGQLVTA